MKTYPVHIELTNCCDVLSKLRPECFACMQATFTSSYMHTCFIMVSMMAFAFRFFAVDGWMGNMGSLRKVRAPQKQIQKNQKKKAFVFFFLVFLRHFISLIFPACRHVMLLPKHAESLCK